MLRKISTMLHNLFEQEETVLQKVPLTPLYREVKRDSID